MHELEMKTVVRVDVDPRGGWQVRAPGRRPVRFATREEAERAAAETAAAGRGDSQVLVRDAYGRVMASRTPGRPADN
jgi:DNA-binding GntR family transcriptional regulator